jgi:hypothetical protein
MWNSPASDACRAPPIRRSGFSWRRVDLVGHVAYHVRDHFLFTWAKEEIAQLAQLPQIAHKRKCSLTRRPKLAAHAIGLMLLFGGDCLSSTSWVRSPAIFGLEPFVQK